MRKRNFMLLPALLLLGSLSNANAQSMSMKNVTVGQAMSQFKQKTGYCFIYEASDLNTNKRVNVSANGINAIVHQILSGQNVSYDIQGKNIVVSQRRKNTGGGGSAPQQSSRKRKVRGTVTDKNGDPIVGATIMEQGTKNGTVSDVDGNYTLDVSDGAKLKISYLGFQEQTVNAKDNQAITMTEDAESLDEVVVVGYEVQRKKDLTGAVGVLKVSDVKDTPVSSVDQMMEGKLSGVNVMPDNMPGGGVAVRVRGFSTIRNNDPLYIIDGIPVENGINFLNPNDIESMQVLKDASSASIYGARAANGVVIITTKKGSGDKLNLRFDGYVGVQQAAKRLHMLNAQEYGDVLWEAMKNDGKTPSSTIYGDGPTPVIPEYLDADHTIHSDDVDWVDEILHPAIVQSYNLTLSKADKQSDVLFSVGYFNQDGIIKYTGFQRLNARFNSDWKLFNDVITIGENMSVSHDWGVTNGNNSALNGTMQEAYAFQSITPVRNSSGEYAGNVFADKENPLGMLHRSKDDNRRNTRFVGNIYLQVQPVKGIMFRSNFGGDYKGYYLRDYQAKFNDIQIMRSLSELTTTHNYRFNWVFTNTLNLTKSFGQHNVNVLLGTEAIRTHYEWFNAHRKGFPYDADNFRYLDSGDTSTQTNGGSASQSTMMSYFGKIDYNYADRYLAAFTIRRDGTSKLTNNRWGNFPAFSLGWRISNEPFFHSSKIDNLKVRFGWGQNGNSDIPPYSTIDSYSSNPNYSNYPINGSQNSVQTGYTLTRNSNPNLKWETTTQTNIGVDLGLFNNTLNISIDYFNKNTKDLLYARPLVATVGGTNSTIWDNVGKMNNKGIEAEINYRKQVNDDFGFNVAFNISHIKNKVTELSDGISYIGIPTSELHQENFDQEISRTAVGHPLSSFYVYKETGIFQNQQEIDSYVNSNGEKLQPNAKPGDLRFADLNGDGVIDGNDRGFEGSPHPDITAGLTLGFNYKNFDLSLFFNSSFGNDVYDLTKYIGTFCDRSQYNMSKDILNAWTPENTNTDIPRMSEDDLNNNVRPSTYYISSGSFVRLKNIKLGYTLPKSLFKGIGLENGYIYLQATNLFTITRYDGIDPEVGLQSYNSEHRNLDIGIDRGIYPLSRTFTFGVNFNF